MENIIVKNCDKNMYGTTKENIFYACKGDKVCGTVCLYPFLGSPDIEFPHNIYVGIHPGEGELTEEVKDILLEEAKKRAGEIKLESGQSVTRLYGCFLQDNKGEISYFESRGFVHDAGMYIMSKNLLGDMPTTHDLGEMKVQQWNMETTEEQLRFIEEHKNYHRPACHYSCESIGKLMKKPLWTNFALFNEDEILGNIMVFEELLEGDNKRRGWVEDLFVRKNLRREGLGKQLMISSLNYFKENGAHELALEVWSDNKNGIAFYKSLGFEIVEETEIALSIYI